MSRIWQRRLWGRALAMWVGLAAVLAAIFFVYGVWRFERSLRSTRLSPQTLDLAAQLFNQVKAGLQPGGEWQERVIDMRGVGFPDRQARLLRLLDVVNLFDGTFRRPPTTLCELPELFQAWPQLKPLKAEYAGFARDCSIQYIGNVRFLLNCDGWKPADPRAVSDLKARLCGATGKFLLLDGHVCLYIPWERTEGCGTGLSARPQKRGASAD